ncbi:MAG: sugar ABC transporter permease [Treponema sp.]|nr:sugar ABC transporter permease [Treponema sp.]
MQQQRLIGKTLKEAWHKRLGYLFLLPYAASFSVFVVAPVVISLFYSFTYYNILQPPKFIGLRNYINLLLADDVFLIAVKNTFVFAVITGPLGYFASFIFAWFIYEIPARIRSFVILVFYAPSISGSVYVLWALIFSGDAYGYINGMLMRLGIINGPVLWLTDPKYMMTVVIIVILWMSLGTGFLAFVAGLATVDETLYEAGLVDGISNRWQELWFITLPNMKGMLFFGAVMAITGSFGVGGVGAALAGFPSTDYAVHTVMNHLDDYGTLRFEMGYASAIATLLFLVALLSKSLVQRLLNRVGT